MNSDVPKPLPRTPEKGKARYSISPRGFVFFLLAIIVLFMGLFGYLEYDRLIKPYMREFLCCVPAVILAGLLFFLGFASRTTVVRKVNIRQPSKLDQTMYKEDRNTRDQMGHEKTISNKDADLRLDQIIQSTTVKSDGLKPYSPSAPSKNELFAQKKNILQFLKNLDEQHKDGLIMDGAYFGLKSKYRRELANLNLKIKKSASGNGKLKQNK
jgi:hypothetical protein